jgi:DNA-binding FrmR family transcriptional regulator
MLPKNLTKDLKDRLKSVKGQVEGILKMLDEETDPDQILNQFKAVKQAFDNAQFLLLDEVFRKTMALKIAQALDACPGDCGQEERIEIIRRQFPELGIEELTAKMKEINAIYDFVRKDKNAEG